MVDDAQHTADPPLQFSLSSAIVFMFAAALVLGVNMGKLTAAVFVFDVLVYDVVAVLLIRAMIRSKSESMTVAFIVPWFLLVGAVLATLIMLIVILVKWV